MATRTGTHRGDRTVQAGGLISRAMKRMIAAREARARGYVNDYIRSLDDSTLAVYGIDRSSILHGVDDKDPT